MPEDPAERAGGRQAAGQHDPAPGRSERGAKLEVSSWFRCEIHEKSMEIDGNQPISGRSALRLSL